MRTPKRPLQVNDDELRQAYEKTSLHKVGVPLERSLARLPWLREVLEGSAARSSPRSNVAQKERPSELPW